MSPPPRKQKLILKCGLAPGDIVMLTAAVRDLHRCYPNRFVTDVRTSCPELWENNPQITPLADDEPGAETIDCAYPLINRCNRAPYHCLHGFISFLNERLRLAIQPTEFNGDLHLSEQEKAWYSQVHEYTGRPLPFWLIAAGGKYDVTIKWWEAERYQEVVDYFRGQIQFVQVGSWGHHHPKLHGVIDLRGRTNLRELVRLVYHAQGVLCPVTSLMHLAAAVETRPGQPPRRPCVVIAGGREPAHWEAYPDHQFIHTLGALRCCSGGGCWKDRVVPLRDGDRRDRPDTLCVDSVNGLPRCMALITSGEVIRRIELYFRAGKLRYLTRAQRLAAERGVKATARNRYDGQALNLHNAGLACDAVARENQPFPGGALGRGIVICGGGPRYLPGAWVCIHMLRKLGCKLPIELWHLGRGELDPQFEALLAPLGVRCVDASKVRKTHPARHLHGWELKCFAILYSRFQQVLLLDADNMPVENPEFLFETAEFIETGAIFWPDYNRVGGQKTRKIWRSCGLPLPREQEFETGQILLDKERCWSALRLTMWFNENSDFYYQYIHGDKETFHLAFRKLRQNYALVPHPIHSLDATMCQHDFSGRRLFQHRNRDKWDLFLNHKRIEDFWFEKDCLAFLGQLQRVWPGSPSIATPFPQRRKATPRDIQIEVVMISCPQREEMRRRTLRNLEATDWNGDPFHLQVDSGTEADPRRRQTRCAFLALEAALKRQADYVLFLEDDLDFNRHLRHNLYSWAPLRERRVALASLYNPGVRELGYDIPHRARLVRPNVVFGSQALLLSREALGRVVKEWRREPGMQDIRISRLAGRLGGPVFYHAPSLVQHIGQQSTWGGGFHQAVDFDASWKR